MKKLLIITALLMGTTAHAFDRNSDSYNAGMMQAARDSCPTVFMIVADNKYIKKIHDLYTNTYRKGKDKGVSFNKGIDDFKKTMTELGDEIACNIELLGLIQSVTDRLDEYENAEAKGGKK